MEEGEGRRGLLMFENVVCQESCYILVVKLIVELKGLCGTRQELVVKYK